MKTFRLAPLQLTWIGAAALAVLPLSTFGQASSLAPDEANKAEEKGVVHIPAGRLEEVLKFLNKRFPNGKFIATPDVLSLQVSDVLVSGANSSGPSLNDVAKAVERASDPLAVSESADSGHPVFTFQKNLILAAEYNAANAVEAFNLEDTAAAGTDLEKLQSARANRASLIQNMVGETISSIRQEGRVPVNAYPQFQFNSTANVLIAIGNPDVLGITRKIVDAVNASARSGMAAKASNGAAPAFGNAPANPSPAKSLSLSPSH